MCPGGRTLFQRLPYTEALIATIPKADGKGTLPVAVVGEVGDPADPVPVT
jgi:hypothetical protein